MGRTWSIIIIEAFMKLINNLIIDILRDEYLGEWPLIRVVSQDTNTPDENSVWPMAVQHLPFG